MTKQLRFSTGHPEQREESAVLAIMPGADETGLADPSTGMSGAVPNDQIAEKHACTTLPAHRLFHVNQKDYDHDLCHD